MDLDAFRSQNPEEVAELGSFILPDAVVQADFHLLFTLVQDESVDLVLTDPPYWSLDRWREVGTTTRLGGHRDPGKRREEMWFPTITPDDLTVLLHETWRVLKPDRHAYIMCDATVLPVLLGAAQDQDWRFVKPLVWDKVNPGMGYHYRATYEFVVMLEKGKRALKDLGIADILRFKRVTGGFPTEKPIGLFDLLVSQSTEPGELVMDPFCGAGTVGVAAKKAKRHYVLGDIQAEAVKTAEERLSQGVLPETADATH